MLGAAKHAKCGSQCQQRCSPISRNTTLRIGGRVLAKIASLALIGAPPWRVGGIWMWDAFFPSLLIQFVCLKGSASHHVGGHCVVQMGLDALP
jgi:hypothetical protein